MIDDAVLYRTFRPASPRAEEAHLTWSGRRRWQHPREMYHAGRPGCETPHGWSQSRSGRASSPWQKGLIVNRESRVRIGVSPDHPTTNRADHGAPGPRSAAHAPSTRSGGRSAPPPAPPRGPGDSAACPARQVPHEQPEIDAADLDEQPFQDVGMPADARPWRLRGVPTPVRCRMSNCHRSRKNPHPWSLKSPHLDN